MKPKFISGYEASGTLKHWKKMLDEWISLVDLYGKATGDKCYIHSERTNVGMLAVATAKTGGIALEEFPWTKKGKVLQESRGRADLWVQCKSKSEANEYVEAKFKWINLGPKKSHTLKIKKVMKAAADDASNTRNGQRGMKCVALAFFPTYIKLKKAEDLQKIIESTVMEFRNTRAEFKNSAIAWCFPSADQMESDDKGNLVPGVILLAKAV